VGDVEVVEGCTGEHLPLPKDGFCFQHTGTVLKARIPSTR
jgi:hypothetical protein